jgi:hypothetical protein
MIDTTTPVAARVWVAGIIFNRAAKAIGIKEINARVEEWSGQRCRPPGSCLEATHAR